MKFRRLLLIMTFAAILLIGSASYLRADETVNFSGDWTLNEKLSQDPVEVMGRMDRSGERGGPGRAGSGRGDRRRGGMDSGMGGNPGSEAFESDRQKQRELLIANLRKSMSHLEIFHEETEFNITDGRGLSQVLIIGEQKNRIWTDRGEMTATAFHQGKSLIITMKPTQGGPVVTRTYLLSDDAAQLVVIEERKLPREKTPTRMRAVYDRDPADSK